ncbi:MAG TPA: bifunctional DNA-formamidopyrimidine glycosylase/DNA-(apurinic or apyrimidinic site) lyase [Terriglobales bacterium]|jgi:formamidopyrimidine-DNA glycosylase|nr:bifunctional DNA-formamidopyrimidine glycosylase/DNA-(apurinic or apyrimidinic site) lyase [Terriglobales bacterium]
MPELPEVETIARGLASRVTGDVIESVWLGSKPEPLKSSASEIVNTLESKRIAGVRRVGKHIVFDLENGVRASSPVPRKSRRKSLKTDVPSSTSAQWIVHLGMTGRMLVCKPNEAIEKHTHAVARLASGRELRFVDPRRFGRLSVAHGFEAAGSEPLEVELDFFVGLFRKRNTPIKSALLNQKLLRGVGNIYADESLFRAGIRPRRRVDSLTRKEVPRLYAAIQEVLKEAIALGGSSVSNYVDADGKEGFFQLQHRVYGREAEPCLVCKTPIKRVVIAGRSSHYCPKCQK